MSEGRPRLPSHPGSKDVKKLAPSGLDVADIERGTGDALEGGVEDAWEMEELARRAACGETDKGAAGGEDDEEVEDGWMLNVDDATARVRLRVASSLRSF